MEKKVIVLAFLSPLDDDPWLNRLTAKTSKHPFCHVKLVFNPYSKPLGFNVQEGEEVTLRPTKLSNPCYTTLSVAMPVSNYNRIYSFCERAAQSRIKMDDCGMYTSYIHPGGCCHISSQTRGATFCSKIICEALQAGELPEEANISPSRCTPSMLYSAFRDSSSQIVGPMRLPQVLMLPSGR